MNLIVQMRDILKFSPDIDTISCCSGWDGGLWRLCTFQPVLNHTQLKTLEHLIKIKALLQALAWTLQAFI